MAINPAVLSALVQPVKSVSDYEDMYAERDARQQRNALLQMQMAQAKQGMQQQDAVRNAFAQYGASPQAVNALMSAGAYPEGMKLQEQLRAQAQEAMRRDALKALQPTQAIDANRVSGVTGPRPEALSVVGQKRPFDPAAMLQNFSPDEVAKMQALVDPRVEVKDYKEVRMPDGSVQLVGFGKDGKVVQTGQVPFVKPEVRDFGGYVGGVDLVSGKVQRYGDKTMSAAERDASARGWASNAIARQRLAFDQGQGIADAGGVNQAALSKQFGKPTPGYRWKTDGTLEKIPGGPADEKATAGEVGKGSVTDIVASLRDMYDQLDKSGGITNPNRGPIGNLAAGLASSDAGQAAGKLFGTQNQSMRNTIAQQRPVLLQAIMKATGMSAKQMDSNAELKLYLTTATDPTLDVAANKRALDMIEQLYGRGSGAKQPAEPNSPAIGPKPTVSNW